MDGIPPRERHYVHCDRVHRRALRRFEKRHICRECWLAEKHCCCAALQPHQFAMERADVIVYMSSLEFGRKSNSTRAFIMCQQPRHELVIETREGDDAMRELFERKGDSVALLYPSSRSVSVREFTDSCAERGQSPTFVLLDSTWAQAVNVRKRLDRMLGGNGRRWNHVRLDLPQDVDAPHHQKRRVAPLWRTPAENGGVSFSPARTQVEIGRITSVECLWLLCHELGENNERVLVPLLEAIRIRISFSLQSLLGARARLGDDVLQYCDRIFNELTASGAHSAPK